MCIAKFKMITLKVHVNSVSILKRAYSQDKTLHYTEIHVLVTWS
jgi:hypothetical protein